MENNHPKSVTKDYMSARNIIALLITLVILGATVYVAIEAIHISYMQDKMEGLKFVAQTLLPLWGTWIGTILAFYFSRENFDAATKSYQNIIESMKPEEKIAKISAKEAMIPLEKIIYLEYEETKTRTIRDILNDEKFRDFNRYVILNRDKTLKYMIHRSTFFRFLAEVSMGLVDIEKNTDDLIFSDMEEMASNAVKTMMYKGFNFISENSTLLDAKKAMDAIPECQDVFITKNGKPTEPILGLVTNNNILEYARV
jgi:hypothetical protein